MQLLLVALSLLYLVLFLYVALRRLHYPFEIERMESGMMTSVWWITRGHALYSAPTLDFVPFLYTPVFLYLSAAMTKLIGVGYAAIRSVSILSTLGTFGLIYAFVWRETRRHLAAIAAAGVFVSLYSVLQSWLDVGRVDSLATCLMMLALYSTRFWRPAVSAVLWVLAFQTKQNLLPLGLLIFFFEWQRPRRLMEGVASYVVFAAASVLWLNHVTHGWYSFYVFGTPGQLKWVWRQAVLFLPNDLLALIGPAIAVVCVSLLLQPVNWRSRKTLFYAFGTFGVLGLVWFTRGHSGAVLNAVMPAYAWLAVLFGLGLARLQQWTLGLRAEFRGQAELVVLLVVGVQLLSMLYNPGRWLPYADTLRAREAFLAELRGIPGDVWVLNHSWDLIVAGKTPRPEMDSFDAVLTRKHDARADGVKADLATALRERRFTAVIFDHPQMSYPAATGLQTPEFFRDYPLQVMAVGAENSTKDDQPTVIRAPCAATQMAGDPLILRGEFSYGRECIAR